MPLFEVIPFSGRSDENVESFCRQCEMHCKPYQDTFDELEMNEAKIMVMVRNLRGAALEWYQTSASSGMKSEYAALKAGLIDKFLEVDKLTSAMRAVRALETLKQGQDTVERYIQRFRQIYHDLPTEVKPRVQEVMLKRMSNVQARDSIAIVLSIQAVDPTFEQVCQAMLRATRPTSEDETTDTRTPTEPARPSKDEEDQVRFLRLLREASREDRQEDRENLVSAIATALGQVKLGGTTQPRVTYPANANPVDNRGGKRVSADNPCFNCWEVGHYSAECPNTGLSSNEKRNRYQKYMERELAAGREPKPLLRSQPRRNEFPPQQNIPVAAHVDADGQGDASEFSGVYLVDTDLPTGSVLDWVVPLEWETKDWSSASDTEASLENTDNDADTEEDNKPNQGDYLVAAAGHKRTRAEATIVSTDDVPMAHKAQRKTKAPPRSKAFRPIRLMEGQPDIDVRKLVRDLPVPITFGQLCNVAPAVTTAVSKSLVRPSKSHRYAPRTTQTGDAQGQAPVIASISTGKDSSIPHIDNVFTPGILIEAHGAGAFMINRVLLDPGATLDLVSHEFVIGLGLKVRPSSIDYLKSFSGEIVKCVGTVRVEIKLMGEITKTLTLYVVKGKTPYTILIGLPGLYAFNATADFRSNPQTYRIRETRGDRGILIQRIMPKTDRSADKPQRREEVYSTGPESDEDGWLSEEAQIERANEYARQASGEATLGSASDSKNE